MTFDSVLVALRGILANRMRSALTMLGILIGTASVILLVAVGTGISNQVQIHIRNLGTNAIYVFPERNGGGQDRGGTDTRKIELTKADVRALRDRTRASSLELVTPTMNTSGTVTWQGNTYALQSFLGVEPIFAEVRNTPVQRGRSITEDDLNSRAKVAVIGATVVDRLMGTDIDPVGQTVEFNGVRLRIVGLLAEKGSNGFQDQDDVLAAPLTTVIDNIVGNVDSYSVIAARALSRDALPSAMTEIDSILRQTHGLGPAAPPDFRVFNAAALLAAGKAAARQFQLLLGFVAAISLLIGGIGIMNIMLRRDLLRRLHRHRNLLRGLPCQPGGGTHTDGSPPLRVGAGNVTSSRQRRWSAPEHGPTDSSLPARPAALAASRPCHDRCRRRRPDEAVVQVMSLDLSSESHGRVCLGGRAMRRSIRGCLAVVLLVAAACGQKAGVGDPSPAATGTVPSGPEAAIGSSVEGGPPGPALGPAGPATTAPTAGRAPEPAQPGGRRSGPGAGPEPRLEGPSAIRTGPSPAVAAGSEATATRRQAATGQAPGGAEGTFDRTGVGPREIVVGVHAPISGAAPLPQEFKADLELYWRWLAERGGVAGRTVRLIVKDDQFNPSRALQVCRELVEVDRVFLLVGIGADQVAACARYAEGAGVPYLSPGGAEDAVAGLSTFFALSMTFPQQAPLLAQLAARLATTKVGVVVTGTPNYDDTFRAMVAAARQAGLTVVRASRIGKQASQSETLAEAAALKAAGAQGVLLLASPLVFLNLATSAQSQAYSPVWMGPGMSNGLNPVAEVGCPAIAGARFLSPFPQLDVIDRFDPDLRAAARRYNNAEPSDITLVAWGLNKTFHRMLDAVGADLHRRGFLATLRSGREFASNVFPPLRFSAGHPFGATQAHLLEADCANRRFKTTATFVSSF